MTPTCAVVPARGDTKHPCVTRLSGFINMLEEGVDAMTGSRAAVACPAHYSVLRWQVHKVRRCRLTSD